VPLLAQDLPNKPAVGALNALAWMQTSVEYRGVALQAWHCANLSLPKALKDKKWTASIEQQQMVQKSWKKLPPAIIVDIDETVLDNSPGQARFLLEGDGGYSPATWKTWSDLKKAKAIPGAAEFLSAAASKGVTVFYVSNRGKDEEEGTLGNLKAEGFPLKDLKNVPGVTNTLLLVGEDPTWTTDKSIRRKLIAKYFRIVLLCGDDANDFFPARIPMPERMAQAREYAANWGVKWIVLPNAMYGSWEDALHDYKRDSSQDIEKAKIKALRTQ